MGNFGCGVKLTDNTTLERRWDVNGIVHQPFSSRLLILPVVVIMVIPPIDFKNTSFTFFYIIFIETAFLTFLLLVTFFIL